jgi:hypothetical protein
MAITDLSPVITHEGAGMARAGVESQPRKGDVRPAARIKGRRPVRRFVPKVAVAGHARAGKQIGPHKRGFPVRRQPAAGGNGTVASFTTPGVNAPANYMGQGN